MSDNEIGLMENNNDSLNDNDAELDAKSSHESHDSGDNNNDDSGDNDDDDNDDDNNDDSGDNDDDDKALEIDEVDALFGDGVADDESSEEEEDMTAMINNQNSVEKDNKNDEKESRKRKRDDEEYEDDDSAYSDEDKPKKKKRKKQKESKKRRVKSKSSKDAEPIIDVVDISDFVVKLGEAYNSDLDAIKNQQPALAKVQLLNELSIRLKDNNSLKYYTDAGLFTILTKWLEIKNKKLLPMLKIRSTILQSLAKIDFVASEIELPSSLLDILDTLKDHQSETFENKSLIKRIFKKLKEKEGNTSNYELREFRNHMKKKSKALRSQNTKKGKSYQEQRVYKQTRRSLSSKADTPLHKKLRELQKRK